MLFNSYLFLFGFLPPVLVGCWALRQKNLRLAFLTLSSWFFYAWWDWRFLPLMLSTTMVDYVAALALQHTDDERRRRLLLIGSLSINLSLLGYFKYAGFFVGSLNGIGRALGAPVDLPDLHLLLPIGTSFYRFPQNFNSPFKAQNISDFWRRWHMSLSAWFRDYLFIPLGGSRRGPARTTINLVLTMFLAGLWHGAAWTFVVWGLFHGVLLGTH